MPLSAEMTATSSRPTYRVGAEWRVRWTGFITIRLASRHDSITGSSQLGRIRVKRSGSANCSTIATSNAAATGSRFSPPVGRHHAGNSDSSRCNREVADAGVGALS